MKQWTKKFLAEGTTGVANRANVLENGTKAEAKLKFPRELWVEIAEKAFQFSHYPAESAFAMGLAVGWAEHEESVE